MLHVRKYIKSSRRFAKVKSCEVPVDLHHGFLIVSYQGLVAHKGMSGPSVLT